MLFFTLPRCLLFAAFVFGMGTIARCDSPVVDPFTNVHNDPLYDQETYQKIRDITVDVSWNRVPLSVVLRDLTLAVRNTHPIRAAINFRMSSEASPADRAQRVTLTARGMPLYQVLQNLTQQVPFTIKVRPDIVLIVPNR
jgi:hypothetical protein